MELIYGFLGFNSENCETCGKRIYVKQNSITNSFDQTKKVIACSEGCTLSVYADRIRNEEGISPENKLFFDEKLIKKK